MNKTILKYTAIVSIVLFSLPIAINAFSVEGSGTYDDPYRIEDWHHLNEVRDELDANYVLNNSLDSETEGYDEHVDTSDGWEPIGNYTDEFNGSFDGNGYEISDLYIDRPNTNYVGLFGYTDTGGVVENVGLIDVDITGVHRVGGLVGMNDGDVSDSYATGSVSGNGGVGGLVGLNSGSGSVGGSFSTGSVEGDSEVGGLVGTNFGGVSGSYSTGSVEGDSGVGGLAGYNGGDVSDSYATGSVEGDDVGGLVGSNNGDVVDSYSTGSVTGDGVVGGLVGRNYADVSGSYATGSVEGDDVGGLVGYNWKGDVSDSYWDTETSGQSSSEGGTGLTTSEMTGSAAETNMSAFNFDNDWHLVIEGQQINPTPEGDGYPILQTIDTETQLDAQGIGTEEPVEKYNLTINSTEGGEVITPGENTFTYEEGTTIQLNATPADGWQFQNWTGETDEIDDVNASETTITMEDDYTITAHFKELNITWENLDNGKLQLELSENAEITGQIQGIEGEEIKINITSTDGPPWTITDKDTITNNNFEFTVNTEETGAEVGQNFTATLTGSPQIAQINGTITQEEEEEPPEIVQPTPAPGLNLISVIALFLGAISLYFAKNRN